MLSRVQLFVTSWAVAYQVLLSMKFSRQDYWSGLPFPSLIITERKCLQTESCTKPFTHNMNFEIVLAQGESSWAIKTIHINLEERQISKQICSSLTQLKEVISMRKMHWLAQGLR